MQVEKQVGALWQDRLSKEVVSFKPTIPRWGTRRRRNYLTGHAYLNTTAILYRI